MSLLTKEQLQILNGIKAMIADCDYKTDQIRGLFDLVSIIDDLQARAQRETDEPDRDLPQEMHGWRFDDSLSDFSVSNMPARPNVKFLSEMIEYLVERCRRAESRAPKQYTEQELREWFENRPLVQDEIDALLHEVVPGENEAWYSVLKFAAHVGALKAETYPDAQTIAEAGATVLEAEP